MNIGIVHEWFASYAGSERVVEQMLQVFPESQLYSLVDFLPEADRAMLGDRQVKTSFVQKLPFARKKFRGYLPLMPLAIEQFDLSEHDVIVSSNHAVAKGVLTRADQLHVCYIHTPIRYAWDLQHQYLSQANLTRGVKSILARMILHYLRLWDESSSHRVDVFVANSRYVAQRVWRTYRREAQVIYPPVDVDAFAVKTEKEDFYLTASRLVPYKKVDVIVDAFSRMPDKKLVVIGDGPEMKKVAAKAGSNVTLLGYQKFAALRDHMQRAKGFVFAADEDFGIMPVEAQACGTPVIAYGRGGVLESVVDGETGCFFPEQTPDSVVSAVQNFERRGHEFDPLAIRAHAETFRPERFRRQFADLIDTEWDRFKRAPGAVMPAECAAVS